MTWYKYISMMNGRLLLVLSDTSLDHKTIVIQIKFFKFTSIEVPLNIFSDIFN